MNYPPEPTGIAPYTGALASELAHAGYRVDAHVAHPHYPGWRIFEGHGGWLRTGTVDGVTVRRRSHYVPSPPKGLKRLASEVVFGARIALARWGAPGAVVAVSPALFATAIAVLRIRLTLRRPYLIVWVQDIYSLGIVEADQGGRLVERVTRWVEGSTLRAADRVVVIHPRFAEYLAHALAVEPSKIDVIRNWTHVAPADPAEAGAAKVGLRWPEGVTLAVHTGNMGVKQGLENIIDAARLADQLDAPVVFILVGAGSERVKLERYGRNVTRLLFVDPLGDSDYRLALSAADVLLVNEKAGVSGMAVPSKLTTYFDAGRPVVAATDEGGITASEVRAAGAGIVVPAGDPAALLSAVLELRANPEKAKQFAKSGRRHREAFLSERSAMERWRSIIADASVIRVDR